MQGKPLVLLLSVLYGSAFIAGFNENLVNMALVSIMAEYGVDSVTAQWLVTGYMIVATVVVTCMAFLYRRFHVRTLFFGAAGLSIVGSAMGLVAPSFELLLVARLVQAVGTGLFFPSVTSVIMTNSPAAVRGTRLALNSGVIAVGLAISPTASGFALTQFGWRTASGSPARAARTRCRARAPPNPASMPTATVRSSGVASPMPMRDACPNGAFTHARSRIDATAMAPAPAPPRNR